MKSDGREFQSDNLKGPFFLSDGNEKTTFPEDSFYFPIPILLQDKEKIPLTFEENQQEKFEFKSSTSDGIKIEKNSVKEYDRVCII